MIPHNLAPLDGIEPCSACGNDWGRPCDANCPTQRGFDPIAWNNFKLEGLSFGMTRSEAIQHADERMKALNAT